MAAAAFAPGLASQGVDVGELPTRSLTPVGVALGLAQCLPLALRRVRPSACLAVIGVAFVAYQLAAFPSSIAGLGLLIALYSAGAHLERGRRGTAVAAAVAYVAFATGLETRDSTERLVDYGTFAVVLGSCWAAGAWVRDRQRDAARREEQQVAAAAARERDRIARELHDVVTHHVTAMVIQADASRHLLDSAPDKVPGALTAIAEAGRRALRELRHQLRVLDGTTGSAAAPREPAGTGVRELVGRIAAAGLDVELVLEGEPGPDPGAAELAAYRVLQESLTNAMKHAPAGKTFVGAHYGPTSIVVDVVTEPATNEGPSRSFRASPSDERGLLGLRTRVDELGGHLTAGERDDGAFVVHASVPRTPSA